MPLFLWDSAILAHFRQIVNPSAEYLSDKTSPFFRAISVSPNFVGVYCVTSMGGRANIPPPLIVVHGNNAKIEKHPSGEGQCGNRIVNAFWSLRAGVLSLRAGSGARPFWADSVLQREWVVSVPSMSLLPVSFPERCTRQLCDPGRGYGGVLHSVNISSEAR